jgi:anaerobic magnesium-protoporphyrin IX monomethyl ester cyclase
MKIAFVQEELYPYLSFMYLAAIAKKMKLELEVFVAFVDDNLMHSIESYDPDIICFSATTPNFKFVKDTALKIKALLPNSFILVGGWHPTFYPEILEVDGPYDALCLGEGEVPFKIFLEAYLKGESLEEVPSFHIKIDGKIYRNPICNLGNEIDDIGFPERSIYYDKFDLLRKSLTKILNVGRGCPYPCTYCFNEKMKQQYKSKGKYVRFRSPQNITKEINLIREKYPAKYIQFIDDTFNSNKRWLLEFLECYRKEVNLPFLANCRISTLDEEVVAKMKEAGVDKINIAIEHGNEEFREKMLRRVMKNSEILEGGRLLRKYNIRCHISNIVGFPGETLDDALETLKINQQMKPEFAAMHVLQPYPGTQIYEIFKEKGYIDESLKIEDMPELMAWGTDKSMVSSVIKQDNINQLVNLHSFFSLLVQHPYFLPLIKPLLSLPPNKYFEFFQAWYVFKFKLKYAVNLRERVNYILQLTRCIFPGVLQNTLEKLFNTHKQI